MDIEQAIDLEKKILKTSKRGKYMGKPFQSLSLLDWILNGWDDSITIDGMVQNWDEFQFETQDECED